MTKVFIDGSSGTTGLRIEERLSARKDIELVKVPYELRHEPQVRKEAMAEADIAFLCLPDEAAKESASLAEDLDTVIIDTSTAHRTAKGWTYGLPELKGQKEIIASSKRIANPGCHATGFILLVQPLVEAGIIPKNLLLTCTSLTGYSGGGKKMIAQYEDQGRDPLFDAPRLYGLTQNHKHLKEMKIISGLDYDPAFCPVVADFYSGMETIIPLFKSQIRGTLQDIEKIYEDLYQGPLVKYEAFAKDGMISAAAMKLRDDLLVHVEGNEDRILLTAVFDNLGKGASGAAIQNMNIVMGIDETAGLVTGGAQ
ncbi:MAG: N-acetyl-gamma-glutamyl-phosphate reductase [Solobacterium sp.]|nr:N-acetyl-gamma-glutamyl-phosphate reductase [Solobacterium sp.]